MIKEVYLLHQVCGDKHLPCVYLIQTMRRENGGPWRPPEAEGPSAQRLVSADGSCWAGWRSTRFVLGDKGEQRASVNASNPPASQTSAVICRNLVRWDASLTLNQLLLNSISASTNMWHSAAGLWPWQQWLTSWLLFMWCRETVKEGPG